MPDSAQHTLMILGPIIFAISTRSYDELRRKSEYRWPTMERLGRRPAKQWIGIGDDKITLKGMIYPLAPGPVQSNTYVGVWQIEEMRGIAEQGVPLDLSDGAGNAYGRWVIDEISETASHHLDNGLPRKQEFELSICRYGEDDLGEQSIVMANGQIAVPRLAQSSGMTETDLFA